MTMSIERQIAGLLIERSGYERRRLLDKVALVDTALASLGYLERAAQPMETATVEPVTERAVSKKATRRRVARDDS